MSTNNEGVSRREFLKRTGVGLAAASAIPTFIPKSVFGANDRVNIAVIGIRGQGGGHLGGFGRVPNVHIATICDVDENLFASRAQAVAERQGSAPKTEWDMRRVFDDPAIDAVTFATPNHWHALGSIWAAQAKKHVYVEKPASHSVWEGRQMVHAARANNVIMQVGFQNRSRRTTRAAIDLLHKGGIGDIYMARGHCFKPRADIGRYPDGPMAEGETFAFTVGSRGNFQFTKSYLDKVHYDMWIGPARERPFNRNRFHYNWHWQFEYGNGDTGNQGPHQMDVGRWGINKFEYPVKVKSSGGMFVHDNAQDTPNTQTTTFEYADGMIFEFSTRGHYTNKEGQIDIGNIFYGSEGWLEIDANGRWATYFGGDGKPGPNSSNIPEEEADAMITVGTGAGGHYGNFIDAVRAGDQKLLTCDIEEGHRSSALACLGNISYLTGRELTFDGRKERFVGDDEANRLLRRENDRAPYVVPDLA